MMAASNSPLLTACGHRGSVAPAMQATLGWMGEAQYREWVSLTTANQTLLNRGSAVSMPPDSSVK